MFFIDYYGHTMGRFFLLKPVMPDVLTTTNIFPPSDLNGESRNNKCIVFRNSLSYWFLIVYVCDLYRSVGQKGCMFSLAVRRKDGSYLTIRLQR